MIDDDNRSSIVFFSSRSSESFTLTRVWAWMAICAQAGIEVFIQAIDVTGKPPSIFLEEDFCFFLG